MKYLFLTVAMPPPFLGGAGTYYYNIFHRFPHEELIIFTEKSRSSKIGNYNRIRYIRRFYIRPRIYRKGFGHYVKKLPGMTRLINLTVEILWSIELILLCFLSRPDVVYVGQLFRTGKLGMRLYKLFGIPYIIFVHGEEIAKAERKKERKKYKNLLDNAFRVICNSSFTREMVMKKNIDRAKIEVVTPMVDTEKYHPGYDVSYLREKYGIKNEKILLSVGRLTRRKGHARVISNMPHLISKVGKLKYIIVGADAGEEGRLRYLAKEKGVEDCVLFAGRVSTEELPKYYCLCDVMVSPNIELSNGDTEGFGMVYLEANACGKPVVGGKAGGTGDAVIHGHTGLLVDNTDEELVNAILKLMTDNKYSEKMGKAGQKRVLSSFEWDNAMVKVRDIGLEAKMKKDK